MHTYEDWIKNKYLLTYLNGHNNLIFLLKIIYTTIRTDIEKKFANIDWTSSFRGMYPLLHASGITKKVTKQWIEVSLVSKKKNFETSS